MSSGIRIGQDGTIYRDGGSTPPQGGNSPRPSSGNTGNSSESCGCGTLFAVIAVVVLIILGLRSCGNHAPRNPTYVRSGTTTLYASRDLNARSGPSRQYGVLYVLYRGEVASVVGYSNGWAQVAHDGKTGLAWRDYLVSSPVSPPRTNRPSYPRQAPVANRQHADSESDFRIGSLRFFECGKDAPQVDAWDYRTSFDHAKARYIAWQLDMSYSARRQRHNFSIHATYYKQDGTVLTSQDSNSHVESGWTGSKHSMGWGSMNPGAWQLGRYKVVLSISGKQVASGRFEVY